MNTHKKAATNKKEMRNSVVFSTPNFTFDVNQISF